MIINNILKTIQTKIVINAGDGYFNFLNLINKDVIKICTMHGNSPKTTLPSNYHKNKIGYNDFDYVSFNNKYSSKKIGIDNFLTLQGSLAASGYLVWFCAKKDVSEQAFQAPVLLLYL